MKIDALSVSNGSSSRRLSNFLNSHYFQLASTIEEIKPVSGLLNDIYTGDFFGLLSELGVDGKYHELIAIANHVRSSGSYYGDMKTIKIPSLKLMDTIIKDFVSRTTR